MDDQEDNFDNEHVRIPQLVRDLSSTDDSVRKMAAFKLQSSIGDPSYADLFAAEGGVPKLQALALRATGNTLAYALASFNNLLGLDQGWDYVTSELTERLIQLVVSQPLINILRGAMSILVAIVSHPATSSRENYGYAVLKPAIERQPTFLEKLVNRLSAADHALCANALQLINALMRDSIVNGYGSEWPKFIKKLQELGVIKSVYALMQGSGLQDLAHPLLEFQSLTKMLIRKWRELSVDLNNQEHRRALKAIRAAGSFQESPRESLENGQKPRDPEKWRKLGFSSESPAQDFEETGYLGLIDFMDFVRKDEEGFQRILLEQAAKSPARRCPTAKTSLAVTMMLCAHFEIDDDEEDQQLNAALDRSQLDKYFKPLILQWSRLHTAGIQAFYRLWGTTGAEIADFNKISDLVSTLLAQVIALAPRTKDVSVAESEISAFELSTLRSLQMNLLEMTHEEKWGRHLRQVKDDLRQEALQFMKEQRIRALLQGAWFANVLDGEGDDGNLRITNDNPRGRWRFVRLSPNRKYVHFADFDEKYPAAHTPSLEVLQYTLDLSQVSSVVSNVSGTGKGHSASSSTETLRLPTAKDRANGNNADVNPTSRHKITVLGYPNKQAKEGSKQHKRNMSSMSSNATVQQDEVTMLTLFPSTKDVAAEWLDGFLMLLNQTPITPESEKLIKFIAGTGLKIRLLNVRFEEALGGAAPSSHPRRIDLPSREGVDDDFFYEIAGT